MGAGQHIVPALTPKGRPPSGIRTAKDVSIPVSSSGTAAKLTPEEWSAKISTSIERRQHWQASMPPRWPPHLRRNLRDSDTGCPGSRCHSGGRSWPWETHGSEADEGLEYAATCEEIAGQHAEETRRDENE